VRKEKPLQYVRILLDRLNLRKMPHGGPRANDRRSAVIGRQACNRSSTLKKQTGGSNGTAFVQYLFSSFHYICNNGLDIFPILELNLLFFNRGKKVLPTI